MQYQAFIDQVRRRALIDEQEKAVRAIHATLETLGERIITAEADELARHLPPEIGAYLRDAGTGERFDLATFYERVARREEEDEADAAYHARVVLSVLHQALPAAATAHLRTPFPQEYDDLFSFTGKGEQEIRSATSTDNYW